MGVLTQGNGAQSAQGAANDSFAWSKAATALSAGGEFVSGLGGMQLANYQAAVAGRNAQLMEKNAQATEAAGQYSASTRLEEGGQVVGRQQAGFGASNIDVNVGSPQRVMQSTRVVSAMDAAMERYNAAKEAYAQRAEASVDRTQSSIYKSAGIGSLLSGISAASGTLLGGASSLSARYAGWRLGQGTGPSPTPGNSSGLTPGYWSGGTFAYPTSGPAGRWNGGGVFTFGS